MSNNCKPIFVVRLGGTSVQYVNETQQHLQDRMNDYHVIVVNDSSISKLGKCKVEFELFNPNPSLQDIDMKAIKKMITSIYKQNKEK